MIGQRLVRNLCVAALLLLGACASQPPAPVVDLSGGRAESPPAAAAEAVPTSYAVRSGDSLYAISVLYDLDWRDLAQWNGISAPYLLNPGMRLRLTAPSTSSRVAAAAPGASNKVTTPQLQVSTVIATAPAPAAALPSTETPTIAPVEPAHTPVVAPVTSPPPAAPTPSAPNSGASAAPTRNVAGIAWRWPAQGKLVKSYKSNDPTAQGIDIAGQRGEPVRAAADGSVVYSGDGLVGYGELIIVKHNDTFLSAYGHNSKRLVHEGDRVHAGQEIAEMGSSGTSQVELHFEIRKQGKPVDPKVFLPPR